MRLVRAFDEGWRAMVVLAEGPKWTSLIDLGTLRHQRVLTSDFHRVMRPMVIEQPEEKIRKRLRARRKFFRHAGASWSPIVDEVIKGD